MANYNSFSILEAATEEICKEFVTSIKNMDPKVASNRLRYLVLGYKQGEAEFISIAAQFNDLVGHSTSADE